MEAVFEEFGLPDAIRYERAPRLLPVPAWGKPFDYPAHFETATVSKLGDLQWNGRAAFLSSARAHERIGLDWRDQLGWDVYFGTTHLGTLRRGLRGGLRFIATEPVTQVSATGEMSPARERRYTARSTGRSRL